jgi:2-octaprenyl-3-methyl-6-methoxy-1,4-benzoquinol hydroxylase/2-octaprenylphenol hydroxylase
VLALDDAAFRAELGCAFDFRLGEITAATPRAVFPLRLRLAERFVSGHCVLAGDTAHLVHPLAGQGMNLGFRDVTCLRRVLRDARNRGSDIGAAHVLRRYERERRSESTLSAYAFDTIERVFGSTLAPVALLRGIALATAGALPPLRMRLMDAAAGR